MTRKQFDIGQSFRERLLAGASEIIASHVDNAISYSEMGIGSESVLEAMFDAAWFSHEHLANDAFEIGFTPQLEVSILGQVFRLDRAYVGDKVKIAVELDGHAFHERTRDQVARRNTRDLALAADGWLVIHLSWDQVNLDPIESARAVREAIIDAIVRANPITFRPEVERG
jgi:very-short-patch-repair endonuclease